MTFFRSSARVLPPHFALGVCQLICAFSLFQILSTYLWSMFLQISRKKQTTARSGIGNVKVVGKVCYCKDSHQTWCTEYLQ